MRRFSPETGEVTGEYRFLGLYTQAAYTESITRIPVLAASSTGCSTSRVPADSHDGKALVEILEGFPREELFEISAEQLAPIALAVLGLGERKQVRLFLRPDAYGRLCLLPGPGAQGPLTPPRSGLAPSAQENPPHRARRRLGRLQRDGG